jgi:hypothetical protein
MILWSISALEHKRLHLGLKGKFSAQVAPLHCDRSRLKEAQFLAVTRQDSLDVAAIPLVSAHPTTNPLPRLNQATQRHQPHQNP